MMGLMLLYLVLAAMSGVILMSGYVKAAALGFTFAAVFTMATVAKVQKQKPTAER